MKKVIIILISLFCLINVKALENDTNVKINWVSNVYYNYVKGGVTYWGQFGYIYVNNEIAYCLDVENHITTSIYSSSQDISNVPLLVKTASYFGYEYEDNLSLKDYMATQLLIWKFMGFNVYFTTESKGNGSIINIDSYINKIETLLNSYGWFPDFNTDYSFKVGNTYEIYDKNNLITDEFLIKNTSNNIINHINNGIVIKTIETGTTYFELERVYKKFATSLVYTAANSQRLFKGKELDSLIRQYYYDVEGAKLNIKINETIMNDSNYIDIKNNKFELYDENDNLFGIYEINDLNEIHIDNLNYGKYILKHSKINNGYKHLDDIPIVIDKEYNDLDIYLEPIYTNIKITKESGNKKINYIHPVSDAIFDIYEDNTIIHTFNTNENGIIEFNLPYGEYIVKERNSDFEYKISTNDFDNEINIEVFEEIYNAKLRIKLYDEDTLLSIDGIVNIDDKEYNSKNGTIITEIKYENEYKLNFNKIEGYNKNNDLLIIIDENSDYIIEDNEVYINIEVYYKKEVILNENIIDLTEEFSNIRLQEEYQIFELPNLGNYA